MFLPEAELDVVGRRVLGRLLDIPGRRVGSAEVNTDVVAHVGVQASNVRTVGDAVSHALEQLVKVRTTKVGARLELGERIDRGADGVDVDVGLRVHVEFLREVDVDAQELGRSFLVGRVGLRLLFEGGEQGLEPFEGGRVTADPDEFDTSETAGWVWSGAQVPDVLEDRGPGCDADTGTDEHGDFVVKHVFGRSSVGTIDANAGHGLAGLESNFVHAHGVEAVVFLGLSGTGS